MKNTHPNVLTTQVVELNTESRLRKNNGRKVSIVNNKPDSGLYRNRSASKAKEI